MLTGFYVTSITGPELKFFLPFEMVTLMPIVIDRKMKCFLITILGDTRSVWNIFEVSSQQETRE